MKDKSFKICALTTISKTMDWFIVDSMRNLSENGYDVTLVCNMEPGFSDRNSDYAKCIDIPMNRGISLSDLFKVPIKLYRLFKKEKFDIVYYTSPNVSFYASLAAKFAGIKHRLYSQCGLRYVGLEGRKRDIFKCVEKITCWLSSTIRAQSSKNMKFAIDEGLCPREKISVVGIGGTIGVSLKYCDSFDKYAVRLSLRKKHRIPQDDFVYGFVGRINADKGVNELISAFTKVYSEHHNTWLILVGMIDNTNPISLNSMNLVENNNNIIFTGNINPEEVYKYMAMFDVLTHPTYREGFGKVLQEAMGMRLPIITTDVPGPSEVVEDGVSGILVKVKNSKNLAEKMKLIYIDSSLRNRLAINGRKRAEKYFDRPIMLENILKDLNQTIMKI